MIREFNLSEIIDLYDKSLPYIERQCNTQCNTKQFKSNTKYDIESIYRIVTC